MDIATFYSVLGEEYEPVSERFCGNESLLRRFLGKFAEERSFDQLRESIEKQDWEEILRCAHTLKGLSANLGFGKLANAAAEIVKAVRMLQYDRIPKYYEEVSKLYSNTAENIAKLD